MTHPALAEHGTYQGALTPEGCGVPGPDDRVMRVSTVGSADLCPGRVHWRSHPDYRDEPGEQLLFGTLVHRLIEDAAHGGGRPAPWAGWPSPTALISVAEEVIADDGLDFRDLFTPDGLARWAAEALDMAVAWKVWARTNLGWPLPDSRWIEQRMAAPIPDSRLWLAGTPDLILPERRLGLDWKTSAKGWPPSRAAGQNQHHAYRWLAREVLDVPLDEWWFVVGNRSTQTWQHYPVTPDDRGAAGFLYRAEALAESLEAGCPTYLPKGSGGGRAWWCTPMYCPAWELCPARYLGDDKDNQPRLVADWPGATRGVGK